jgi:peptidoglycan/LPS O-acetylase OafA/YrhL
MIFRPPIETRTRSEKAALSLEPPLSRGYLEIFNLFRVVACLAVLGQHSFIWANMSDNFVGTGFITVLHLSRTCFFFLTGLVVCYAQRTHPRSLTGFWKRRYWEIGIPYLAWTGIYLVFTLITVNASWNEAGAFLRHTLPLGYSQMYFVVVIFQFYLLFPLLLKLFQKTRHHGRVMAASLVLALVVSALEHYHAQLAPVSDVTGDINSYLPITRNFLTYQVYFVAGMLVALHLDQVLHFVARRYRQILMVTAGVGVLQVAWYMISVWTGNSLLQASDIYQPSATVWCLAAIAGLFSLSWWWDQRTRPAQRRGRTFPTTASLAALTGGIFFAHTLFISLIRSALDGTGLRTRLPWEAIVAILFVGTVSVTATCIALVLRTPLRWVLGGPVRSEQRASYNASAKVTKHLPQEPTPLNGQSNGHGVRPLDSVAVGMLHAKGGDG